MYMLMTTRFAPKNDAGLSTPASHLELSSKNSAAHWFHPSHSPLRASLRLSHLLIAAILQALRLSKSDFKFQPESRAFESNESES